MEILNNEKYLSIKEFSEETNRTNLSVRGLMNSGHISFIKIGNSRYINESQIIIANSRRHNKIAGKSIKIEDLGLIIIEKGTFNGLECNFYKKDNEICMTRDQIGKALEYANPKNGIQLLHERHEDRFNDKNSVIIKLNTPGGNQNAYMYNLKGIQEICRWSRQEKANEFMDWCQNIIEKVLTTGKYDHIEEQIKVQVQDTEEQKLLQKINLHQQLVSLDPNNQTNSIMLENAKLELTLYKQNKATTEKLEDIDKRILQIENKVPNINTDEMISIIKDNISPINPEKGEYSPKQLANLFNFKSTNNNPHTKLINNIVLSMGININAPNQDNELFRTNGITMINYDYNVAYKLNILPKIEEWLSKHSAKTEINKNGQTKYQSYTINGTTYRFI